MLQLTIEIRTQLIAKSPFGAFVPVNTSSAIVCNSSTIGTVASSPGEGGLAFVLAVQGLAAAGRWNKIHH